MNTKNLVITIAVASLIGIGGYGTYQLGVHKGMQASVPDAAQSQSAPMKDSADETHGRKVLYWHDPMVPTQKFDKPGKSPFMDMQLEPVYADGDDDGSQVTVNSRIQQNLGIRTAEVTQGKLSPAIEVVGNVAYNDRDVALVQARANGFIEKLYVRAPLDPVRKGQALAEVYVPDWVAAQEEFLTVKKMGTSVSDDLLDGARQRMRLAGMTDDQVKQVESAGKIQARLTIYAPAGGVVSELSAREGMTVMAGAPLFRINGTGSVWVNADVPENLAAQVRPGNLVEAHTQALPNRLLKGRVSAIIPQVDITTRTLQARIELANPSGRLVPGMFVNVNFAPAKANDDVLMIPSEAIIQTGQRTVVMIAQGDGKFTPVDVKAGVENNGMTEVSEGLQIGQKVVISGQFLIDSEASLRGISTRTSDGSMPAADKAMTSMTHHGKGKVEAISKDDITLSHEPISTLNWGAMTMGFKLPVHGLPKNIAVGDTVLFEIQPTKDGEYQITNIKPSMDSASMNTKKPMADMSNMKDMTEVKK
ncbi:MAG TPA: efflux RND transporter periplasmic adaptor subunit [Methylophilaceae bacterium]|jgi:Cu(I)/Ag(I) efflux system membrane fusion protein